MTLNQLIEKFNKIILENPEFGKLQVFSTEQGECQSIDFANLALVNKKNPTKNFALDYSSIISEYNSFNKEDYIPAVILT